MNNPDPIKLEALRQAMTHKGSMSVDPSNVVQSARAFEEYLREEATTVVKEAATEVRAAATVDAVRLPDGGQSYTSYKVPRQAFEKLMEKIDDL